MNKIFSRRSLLVTTSGSVFAVGAAMLFGWWQVDGPGGARQLVRSRAVPLPLTEMDFQLTNHAGQSVRPRDWVGRPILVFFGFTFCPDVCPTTLSEITSWLDELGEDGSRFHVAFITVDPANDTVQTLADYVSNFHSAIVGYTGSASQLAKAATGFQAKFDRVSTGNSYTMNHTASVFVFNTDGSFISTIDYHEQSHVALLKLRRALQN